MADDTGVRIRSLIANHLGRPLNEVVPNSRIIQDLGADSLDLVELLQRLEEEFDTRVDERTATHLRTVGDVISYIDGIRSVAVVVSDQ